MADLTCPECGSRAEIMGDFLVCQGPIDITDSQVSDAEFALRKAVSVGSSTDDLDAAFRAITRSKTCGKRWNPDGSPIEVMPSGHAPPDFTQGKDGWR